MNKLTHFDKNGNAVMVDVSQKNETERIATACSSISLSKETLECIKNNQIGKGDVLGVARVAGIMAAKKTSDLIPMCHPLMLTSCNIDYEIDEINSNIKIYGKNCRQNRCRNGSFNSSKCMCINNL